MNPILSQIEEIEAFFRGNTIPKAITQTDAPKFVKEKIALLKESKLSPRIAENFYYHLEQLKKAFWEPVR